MKTPNEAEMVTRLMVPLVEKLGMSRAAEAMQAAAPICEALKEFAAKINPKAGTEKDAQLVEDVLFVVEHVARTTREISIEIDADEI